jgi:hypothetical protein
MAARIAGNGFNCFCVSIRIFYVDGFLNTRFTQYKKEDILIPSQIKRVARRDTKFKLDGKLGDFKKKTLFFTVLPDLTHSSVLNIQFAVHLL